MAKRAGHCKHYTREVYERKACAAGVNVRERVGGDDLGWFGRIPCHPPIKPGAQPAFACEHFAEPTAEEIAAEKAESKAGFERIMKARGAILEAGAKPHSAGKLQPCPVCEQGALHWSMASNGHVHASCATAGCVSWME